MEALRFLYKLVEEDEAVGKFGRPFGVFRYSGINELLEQAILVAFINA
jgi:hypothetical protein